MTDTQNPPTTATVSIPVKRTPAPVRLLENYALPLLTVVVYAFFCFFPLSSTAFPTMSNLNVILGNNAVIALISIAAIFPLVCGYFDFSLGATAVMAQVITAGMMTQFGLPLWLAILIALCLGTLVGVINGYFVTKLG